MYVICYNYYNSLRLLHKVGRKLCNIYFFFNENFKWTFWLLLSAMINPHRQIFIFWHNICLKIFIYYHFYSYTWFWNIKHLFNTLSAKPDKVLWCLHFKKGLLLIATIHQCDLPSYVLHDNWTWKYPKVVLP